MKKGAILTAFLCLMLAMTACDAASITTTHLVASTTTTVGDTVAPVFSGQTAYTFAIGHPLDWSASALGITAWDDRDGDVSGSITQTGAIDHEEEGTYPLVYRVADAAGNVATYLVTVTLIDYSFRHDVTSETFEDYFEARVEQTIGGNGLMIYKVVVDVKPAYAVTQTIRIRMDVHSTLGYRTSGSADFSNRTRREEVVIHVEKGERTAVFEYSVRIDAVEVQARQWSIEILGASGQVKTK